MAEKTCLVCKETQPLSAFPFRKDRNTHLSKCYRCKREYDRKYWEDTKEKRLRRKRKNVKAIKLRNRQFVWDFLLENPCVECGEADPIVLDFDHLFDKENEVSVLAGDYASLARIKKEIEKCQVLCANCHRRKTAKDLEWFTGYS